MITSKFGIYLAPVAPTPRLVDRFADKDAKRPNRDASGYAEIVSPFDKTSQAY